MSEIIDENVTAVEKTRDQAAVIEELEAKMKLIEKDYDSLTQQHVESTRDSLAKASDQHQEDIQHKEMMLEQVKSVRDSAIKDLAE